MAKRARKVIVFTQRVEHPGTRAQPYLLPAVQDAQQQLVRVFLPKAFARYRRSGALMQELELSVKSAAFYGLRLAQRLCPVKTGHLRRSLTAEQRDALSWTVGTNINYAQFVEEGTKPHVIVPRKASVLRFIVKRPRVTT